MSDKKMNDMELSINTGTNINASTSINTNANINEFNAEVNNERFSLSSSWPPAGDQPKAIEQLVSGFRSGRRNQVLLGVTGSGKTFTMANVIDQLQVPALILAPNKTLAAQLFEEMKSFFPHNAVEYFISYYDYYQPEAYKPASNTYIPKESQRNQKIDQLRHSATRALCENKNTIIVASVSCIYGIGSVEAYKESTWTVKIGQQYNKEQWSIALNMMQYVEYSDLSRMQNPRGTFNEQTDTVLIDPDDQITFLLYPSHLENRSLHILIKNGMVENIQQYNDEVLEEEYRSFTVYPNTHHVVQKETVKQALDNIEQELEQHTKTLRNLGKIEELERLQERTRRDMQLLDLTLTCPGIENYSRYFTGREPGQPPPTLYEFFPKPFLCIVDESHMMVPQLRAMEHADRRRKQTLIEYGFRLPSCLDNRPLNFDEWNTLRGNTMFVSATPGKYEHEIDAGWVEQVIRPTGLVDPEIEIRPTKNQLFDAIREAQEVAKHGHRTIMLTLTKKMAERISSHLISLNMKSEYIHADVTTLARVKLLQNLRKGIIDVIVGINLLREGIDIPECGLVVIFDADQEGYLRSQTALIQMIGRAARNSIGKVILYADKVTNSMKAAIDETNRRREIQMEYNRMHSITPTTTYKEISTAFDKLLMAPEVAKFLEISSPEGREKYLEELEQYMRRVANERNFELAIKLRESIRTIKKTGLLSKEEKVKEKNTKEENTKELEIDNGESDKIDE